MRRPLLSLTVAFVAGCLVADPAASREEALALVGLTLVLLAVSLAVPPVQARLPLCAAALALGALATEVEGLRFEATRLGVVLGSQEWVGQPVHLVGRVRGDPRPRAGRLRLTLDLEEVRFRGQRRTLSGRALVEIGGTTKWPTIVDGEGVAVWATLRPATREEGVRRDFIAWGYCKSARLVERTEGSKAGVIRRALSQARAALRAQLMRTILPGPERGLVLAMVLGDRSELDEPTAEAFRASGTYHVLALSGAQVALVAALIVGALRWLRVGPGAEAVVTSATVWFYALLVGGDVPIIRAALMASAVLAGRAFDLAGDAVNLLGLAALALLVVHPGYAWDVGFQLSFAATLGILVLAGPLGLGVSRLPLRAELAVIASVAAQVALSPLLALHFHRLAPAALVLNLAAVPLSAAVLLAGLASLALTPWTLAASIASDVAWVAAHALRRSGDLGPLAPWLDVRVAAPTVLTLGVHAAALALLMSGRRGRGFALLAVSHLGLLLGPPPVGGDGRLHLSVLDVGQGDSLLLRSPSGRSLLVDTGGSWNPRYDVGERRVAPVLWRAGARWLDGLVLTHFHADHAAGAPFLLRAFGVEEVWEGPAVPTSASWRRLDGALRDAHVTRRTVFRGVAVQWDGVALEVLGPKAPGRVPERIRNEDSVVILARLGEVAFLLTGDVQGPAEDTLELPLAAVVKMPHHGSRTSSRPRLVAATRPRLAVASLGARNPFGYPHPEVVGRYAAAGALVLRTDRDGTVEVATDGRRLWVRTSGEALERRIR